MTTDSAQSEFEREVETYREAMDSLHRMADDKSRNLSSLDDAMVTLQKSVTEMTDAFDEYDRALDEFDDAVVSLQRHASEDEDAGRDTPTATRVAGD